MTQHRLYDPTDEKKSWNKLTMNVGKGMNYEEKLVKSVNNPHGYLWFDDSGILSGWDGIAQDAYDKQNLEGYFTAAIISHQLTEKILLLMVRYSDLLIQASIYPVKMDTESKNLDSWGKLIRRHKTTVIFSRKREMIRRAKAINDARIKLVHYLEKESDEDNIRNLSKLIRDDFEVFFRDWQKAMKWFYSEIGLLKAQSRWKELFTKYSLD